MSDMMEYKCPACGGALEFDSKIQKLKCPFCDSEIEIAEFQEEQPDRQPASEDGADSGTWKAMGGESWQEGETAGMRVYSCESCGGEIVAEKSTGATTCPFCGNRIVMKGQFAGDLKPDYIIPFKLDKKAAKDAYHRHLKGKTFLPKVFKKENHIDEIKGVYVPFWLFDVDAKADISYDAERVMTWTEGDTEYTETEFYRVQRSGSISFERIPTDGSKKMDDALMEAIEPYDFADAVPFQPAYMAGYMADRYDVDQEERMNRARERIKVSTEASFRQTVQGYDSVTPAQSTVSILSAKYWYALYPVWLLNTTWKDQKFTFAMNGQTGKIVGDLPFDKGLFWKYVAIRGTIIGAILYALMWGFTLM